MTVHKKGTSAPKEHISPATTLTRQTKRWLRAAQAVCGAAERMRRPIDFGILGLVIELQALGIETCGSSEGQLNQREPGPRVDMGCKLGCEERSSKGAKSPSAALPVRYKRQQQELAKLLRQFYSGRQVPADQKLGLSPTTVAGVLRLAPQGGGCEDRLTLNHRRALLRRRQHEVDDFASYLRHRFLASR